MDTMLNFNRLKVISDDKVAICKALQKSTSGLMEVCCERIQVTMQPIVLFQEVLFCVKGVTQI